MIILLISIIIVYFSVVLFKIAAGSMSLLKLNTVSYVVYYQIITVTVIGSIIVANNMVDYHYMISPVSNRIKVLAWLGVMYSIIAMPLGMILLNNIFHVKSIHERLQKYLDKELKCNIKKNTQNQILFFFLIFSLLILLYVLHANDTVPLFELFKGNKEAAAIGRITVRRHFGGIEYIKNLLGYVLIPIFAYYSYILWKNNKSKQRLIIMILQNIVAILLLMYDTQKAPVVFFLMGYIIIHTFISGGINKKQLFMFIGAGLLIVTAGYVFTSDKGFNQLIDPTSALYGRIFISGYGGYVLSLQLFPDTITQSTAFIGIPSFVLDFLHLPSTESARLLMEYINPEGVKEGTANLISSYYLGEAYANYGLIGLLIAPFVVGIVIQSVHLFLIHSPKDPIYIATYAYITIKWLLNAGFVNFLYLKIILYPLVLISFVKLFLNIFKKKTF